MSCPSEDAPGFDMGLAKESHVWPVPGADFSFRADFCHSSGNAAYGLRLFFELCG